MEKKKDDNRFWIRGGLIGTAIPLVLFGLFQQLNSSGIAFGENPLTAFLVLALAFMELPTAIIGRTLGLPIEAGGAAFLIYNFTVLGYILTITFWALVGVLFGWIIDKKISRKKGAV